MLPLSVFSHQQNTLKHSSRYLSLRRLGLTPGPTLSNQPASQISFRFPRASTRFPFPPIVLFFSFAQPPSPRIPAMLASFFLPFPAFLLENDRNDLQLTFHLLFPIDPFVGLWLGLAPGGTHLFSAAITFVSVMRFFIRDVLVAQFYVQSLCYSH